MVHGLPDFHYGIIVESIEAGVSIIVSEVQGVVTIEQKSGTVFNIQGSVTVTEGTVTIAGGSIVVSEVQGDVTVVQKAETTFNITGDVKITNPTINVNIGSISEGVVFDVDIKGSVVIDVKVTNLSLNMNIGSMTREVTYALEDSFPGTSLDTTKWTIVSGTPSVSNSILVLSDPSVNEEIASKKKFYPPVILTVRAKVPNFTTTDWYVYVGLRNPTGKGYVSLYLGTSTASLAVSSDDDVTLRAVSWTNDNNWHIYKIVFLANRVEVWRDGIFLGAYEGNLIPKQGGDGTGFCARFFTYAGCELDVDWVEVTQEEFNRSRLDVNITAQSISTLKIDISAQTIGAVTILAPSAKAVNIAQNITLSAVTSVAGYGANAETTLFSATGRGRIKSLSFFIRGGPCDIDEIRIYIDGSLKISLNMWTLDDATGGYMRNFLLGLSVPAGYYDFPLLSPIGGILRIYWDGLYITRISAILHLETEYTTSFSITIKENLGVAGKYIYAGIFYGGYA